MKETRAEKNYVSEAYFRMWVKAMYDQFMDSNAVVQSDRKNTYVYLRSKVGVAKCNSTDTWDDKTGIAYAWARCTGQPVYYIEKAKYVPKAGDWVYVDTINKTHFLLKYIDEDTTKYCFKENCGRLVFMNKYRVTKIRPEE